MPKTFNYQTGNFATGEWQATTTKDGKPMWISPEGETWLHEPPPEVVNRSKSINDVAASETGAAAGGPNPDLARPGIDDQAWTNILQPSAYQYGGKAGGATEEVDRYTGLARAADLRQAPSIADTYYGGQYGQDRALESGSREGQQYGLGQLQSIIEGRGPSVAQQQMNAGLANAMQQQASIAASARGGGANLAAAQQAAANAAAGLSGNAVQQGALLRAQEQTNAINAYGGLAGSMRGQDLQRAGLSGQLAAQSAQLQLQNRTANDSRNLAYEQMRRGVFQDQMAARQAGEAANQGVFQANADRAQRADEAATAERNRLIGTAGTVVGGAIGTLASPGAGTAAGAAAGGAVANAATSDTKSDVRAKKDIGDGAPAVRATLSGAAPYTYDYKNPQRDGQGRRIGVMAQDLERGPLGAQVVKTGPDGQKVIDGKAGLGLALAAASDQEKRLQALEARAGGGGADPIGQAAMARTMTPDALHQAALAKAQRDVELQQIDQGARAAANASLAAAAQRQAQGERDRTALELDAQMAAEQALRGQPDDMALARAAQMSNKQQSARTPAVARARR